MPQSDNGGNFPAKRRKFIKLAGAGSVVTLAGCTGGNGGTPTPTEGANVGDTATPATGWKFGKTMHYIGPPAEATWWKSMPAGHMIEAQKRGWDFTFTATTWDAAKINDQIKSFAKQKDALVLNPVAKDAHVDAIETVKQEHNTPVVGNKDLVGGAVTHNIQSTDLQMGELMAKRAIQWIKDKHGTTEGKTLAHFQGNPDFTGWARRIRAVGSVMENHPEMNYKQIKTGGTVSGWAESANTYLANNSPDAIVSDSDGAFTRGILKAMETHDKLFHVNHSDHIYLAGIDGYPSSLTYVRKGLQDLTVPQTPYAITQNIAKVFHEQILDPAIQNGKEIGTAEVGTELTPPNDPVDIYWGPGESITLEMSDYGVPLSAAPPEVYGITPDNVNKRNHWGNFLVAWVGRENLPLMAVEFNPNSDRPSFVQDLLDEFDQKLKNGDYGKSLDYLSKIFG